jgi:hypothetical protein
MEGIAGCAVMASASPSHPWRRLWPAVAALALAAGPAWAQSALLDSVKNNPAKAKALCGQLRELNSRGIASTSPQAVTLVAQQQNLSPMDAEVLNTYVVGLYCPDVR